VAQIELNTLEPYQDSERELALHSPKFGEKGRLRIKMNFRSEYLVKPKKPAQMTFYATKTMTQLTSVFKKERDFMKPTITNDGSSVLGLPAEQASPAAEQLDPLVPNSVGFPSSYSDHGSSEENKPGQGTLKVTVLEAEHLALHDVKPYVTMRLGDKEVKTKPAGKVEKPEWYVDLFIGQLQRD
jgi:Ca2+-dependent lipid-binding protein